MLDVNKLKYLKLLLYGLLVVVAVGVGIGIGQSTSTKSDKKTNVSTAQSSQKSNLTQKQIKEFLLNYYTKKDLGENRNRYKEYMTDALYQQTIAKEDEPTTQTYKGFVVDFEFKSAVIYINDETNQVIAQVTYVNTLLDEKKNYDTAQKDVSNNVTLRLSYIDQKGQLKVNKMESIILTDQTGNYGILDSSSSEETSNSSSATETNNSEKPAETITETSAS
ncbi:TPA: hypothetical protein TT917_001555 [Streptococcus equi subsp. zooepidemicus]|uniref:Parvulin-like peptidyl-prolyl isomerase n=1 Tax=Streptococcus equi subsp. zooepidemicus TaxID=40041 RepID=A0A7Z8ZUR2_STRSZ|nr:hypothetical protein [Streptococcus equi]KIS13090.1 parvulin-like peptidyl-prolyl isomerase [Streptococcus equi subsp. zooepidemicus SzAM60]MCD3401585.1 hypothetical protein [Streptococcus equi subsp. zooepidemicus]VEF04886.1 parvulin-like peptidyl-prolyl isomerase [Streptococcus equi subsp. zooepidemicus]HEL0020201.1 hypothetical protein [Streptococcus equi subsp. zooepidemicus]HEL0022699.1 hypothetical protein [Streptococcus equi subsp. zooepidemicus]